MINSGFSEISKKQFEQTEKINPQKSLEKTNPVENRLKERQEILKNSPYSMEVNEHIHSLKELEIYKNANLTEKVINGKDCLIRKDIDPNFTKNGMTNKERMEKGLAPFDKNGKRIELHHIGQKEDSPLAELTSKEHRSRENFNILHQKKKSEIDRANFAKEQAKHWQERAKMF